MSSSLLPLAVVAVSALAPYVVWLLQRRTKQIGLYVMPLLHAAEDLQSRVYNVMERGGLGPLLSREGGSASLGSELVYMIATYCGWERVVCQHGPFVRDREFVRIVRRVRKALATDQNGMDTACLFRPTQADLGYAAVALHGSGPEALFRGVSQREFQEIIGKDETLRARVQGLADAVRKDARRVLAKESPEGQRLARLQAELVQLLNYLEQKANVAMRVDERKAVTLPSTSTSRRAAA